MESPETRSESVNREKPSLFTLALGCAIAVLAILLLLLFISFVASIFHSSLYDVVSGAERWADIIANLVVMFVAFPAFRITKDRAFLLLAIGALCFAYGTLFSLLLGVKPPAITPRKWSHIEVQLYYGSRCAIDIIGLVCYAWGITLFARRATR